MRFHRTWSEEANDQLSEWFWTKIVGGGILGFFLVSSPVFLVGTVTAPEGVNRVNHATEMVARQHAFLWSYVAGGVKNTVEVLAPTIDNGSSDNG
jgi:hypothetical protein